MYFTDFFLRGGESISLLGEERIKLPLIAFGPELHSQMTAMMQICICILMHLEVSYLRQIKLTSWLCVLSRFSHVQLSVTLWTIDCQAPLSMGFCRQEYWSALPFPPLGNLPNPGIDCRCHEGIAFHWRIQIPWDEMNNNQERACECQWKLSGQPNDG